MARKKEKKPEHIPGASSEYPSFPGTSGPPSISPFRKVNAQPSRRPFTDYHPRELRELLLEFEGIVQKLKMKFPALAETWCPNETEREAAIAIEDANQQIQEINLELIRQGGLESTDTGSDVVESPQIANAADPSQAPHRQEDNDHPVGVEREIGREQAHKRGRAANSETPKLDYRSEVKRAILVALTRKPAATDAQICRQIDSDGSAELPESWKSRPVDRLFFEAYADGARKHKFETAITKVRRDMRKAGLLRTR